jgi:ArsR family transcriptional regulator
MWLMLVPQGGKMLSIKEVAQGYAAVGSEARLSVLLLLVQTGEDGLTISEIGHQLGIAASTLAHHLRHLVTANMIIQEKQGREVRNTANFDYLEELGNYLLLECCKNSRRNIV